MTSGTRVNEYRALVEISARGIALEADEPLFNPQNSYGMGCRVTHCPKNIGTVSRQEDSSIYGMCTVRAFSQVTAPSKSAHTHKWSPGRGPADVLAQTAFLNLFKCLLKVLGHEDVFKTVKKIPS